MQNEMPWQLEMFNKTLKKQMKIKHIRAHLGDIDEKSCLLVTCGDNNGAMNYHLRNAGGRWVWAEFEEKGIAQMAELLGEPVIRLEKGDCKIPFPDETFDCVVVIDCHEHLEDPLPFTKELSRVTKEAGKVVVSVPNGDERMLGVKIKKFVRMTKEKYGHVVTGYDLPELSELLQQAQLRPVGASSYSKFFTEMLELLINATYVLILAKKSGAKVEEGTIAPATEHQLRSVERSYKVYSRIYPLVRLVASLDALLFFAKGYALVVEARKN